MDTRNNSWDAFCHCGLCTQALSVGRASDMGHDTCPQLEELVSNCSWKAMVLRVVRGQTV